MFRLPSTRVLHKPTRAHQEKRGGLVTRVLHNASHRGRHSHPARHTALAWIILPIEFDFKIRSERRLAPVPDTMQLIQFLCNVAKQMYAYINNQ